LAAYQLHVQKLEKDFKVLDLHHVPHTDNVVIDDPSTKAFTWAPVPDEIFERRLLQPTVWPTEPGEEGETNTSKMVVLMALFSWSLLRIVGATGDSVHPSAQDPDAQTGLDAWITEIRDYLKDNILPDEHVFTERIVRVAKRYTLLEGDLYRRGANNILLRYITREDGCALLTEIHGGKCDIHASSHTLVDKAF
jgi:hypothetical protein